jgi:peptidoglycan/xylan/chitin deacetylase (PgdA/CDA1 family)
MLSRRIFATGIAALAVAGCAHGARRRGGPAVAVTIDDFEIKDTPLLSAQARHDAVLDALDRHRLKAAGFPTGKFIDSEAGADALRAWSEAGHLVGNHSYSHSYFGGASPDALMQDVLRAEALLRRYPTYRKLFRFPYLAEGRTIEGRDQMRALLRRHGYRNAHVTVDTSDWYVNARLLARLSQTPGADVAPYRRYYLDHLWDRARYYDDLARRVVGGPVSHTLLLHHNLLNGLFLNDALDMFRSRGWGLIDAAEAFEDPLYAREPDALPAGQSLIWALARQDGLDAQLRYPGESDAYEKEPMQKLGL